MRSIASSTRASAIDTPIAFLTVGSIAVRSSWAAAVKSSQSARCDRVGPFGIK